MGDAMGRGGVSTTHTKGLRTQHYNILCTSSKQDWLVLAPPLALLLIFALLPMVMMVAHPVLAHLLLCCCLLLTLPIPIMLAPHDLLVPILLLIHS